jgi:hypothetical protein
MKPFLSIVLFTMICASPTLAQKGPTTTAGGGPDLTVQSTNGARTLEDTTVHTTLDNGVVVSPSAGTYGNANGGVVSGDGTLACGVGRSEVTLDRMIA